MSSIFIAPIFDYLLPPHFKILLFFLLGAPLDISSKLFDLELLPEPDSLVNFSQLMFDVSASIRDWMSYLFSGMVGGLEKRESFTRFFISSFLYFLLSLSHISSISKFYISWTSSDSKRPFYISTKIPTRYWIGVVSISIYYKKYLITKKKYKNIRKKCFL